MTLSIEVDEPPTFEPTIATMARAFGRSPASDDLLHDFGRGADELRSSHASASEWVGVLREGLEDVDADALKQLRVSSPDEAAQLRSTFERALHAARRFQVTIVENARIARGVLDALSGIVGVAAKARPEYGMLERAVADFERAAPELVATVDDTIDILLIADASLDPDNDEASVPYEVVRRELGLG